MDQKRLFLEALSAAVQGKKVDWQKDAVSSETLEGIFRLAQQQSVLPMIFGSVYACPAFASLPPEIQAGLRQQVRLQVVGQMLRTQEFLQLTRALLKQGLQPIVVKGIVCRQLYPDGDSRVSGDEDLYIPLQQFEAYHSALLEENMEMDLEEVAQAEKTYEVPYHKKGGRLVIELHTSLFSQDSLYGNMNALFEGSFDRAREEILEGTKILTLCPTDHFIFLIAHAYKHFIGSGFGIRQVCDIALYANRYGGEIDWDYAFEACARFRSQTFAATLLAIGEGYFDLDRQAACCSQQWFAAAKDPENLLSDLLDAGVFGDSDMSRKHSSNITLQAVTAQHAGKTAGNSVFRSVFLPAHALENRYPYLGKYPWLLPVAWVSRMVRYIKAKRGDQGNQALVSIRIGSERIALLKEYGILDKDV